MVVRTHLYDNSWDKILYYTVQMFDVLRRKKNTAATESGVFDTIDKNIKKKYNPNLVIREK